MKKIRIRKWTLGTLWAMLVAALTTVPAFADLIIPGQPRQPSPTPDPTPTAPVTPDPAPFSPDPAPVSVPAQPDPALLTVLIVGVAVIAAAVIAWVVIRRRRNAA